MAQGLPWESQITDKKKPDLHFSLTIWSLYYLNIGPKQIVSSHFYYEIGNTHIRTEEHFMAVL